MKKIWAILLMVAVWAGASPLRPQTAAPDFADSTVHLNDSQWKAAAAQFEDSVSTLSAGLEKCQADMKQLQTDIRALEEKIARLRGEAPDGSGVIDEFRLKGMLNDLRDKLEKNAELQRQWDEQQKDFEQKAMSLVSLYNNRIDTDLQAADLSSQSPQLNETFNDLVPLIQKRNRTLALIKQYQQKNQGENPQALVTLGELKSNDKEGLLLTLDLIRDRKKNLEEQLEKWAIEEDEVKNELKLQGKMKEFLDDIQRMNEDSSFPHGSLKRSDLGDVAGEKERKRLQARLEEVQKMTVSGQITLNLLDKILEKVQDRLAVLDKGGEK